MPSPPSPPSSSTLTHRLKLRFSLLLIAVHFFFSLLYSIFSRLISVYSAYMDDLFAVDDLFNTSDDLDDDLLFSPRRNRRHEFISAEDPLYLVPFRWWNDAWKEAYCNSDEIRGDVYESSSSLQDDSNSTVDSDFEVTFSLTRKEKDDSEGSEDDSRLMCNYALLPETMWFKALKWHSDYRTASKDLGCSLAAEGDSWDLFPIQLRLSTACQTGSVVVKICQTVTCLVVVFVSASGERNGRIWVGGFNYRKSLTHCGQDNKYRSYGRAYELFGQQSSMIQIWDFSGRLSKLLNVDDTQDYVSRENVEIPLELQIYQPSGPNSLKMNGDVISDRSPSSCKDSWGRGHGGDHLLGLTGLLNLGNTCFMNSAVQCLVHTPKLVDYFLGDFKKEINSDNPLGLKGQLALAFGDLLRALWRPGGEAIAPREFKSTLACFAPRFSGYNQHDSQEFLAFLLDGLHEDLNRVKNKPYKEVSDADGRPDDEVADEYWQTHLARNDSIIVDSFQGQFRSTLTCPMCKHVSVTFDPFMYLSLPLPSTTMRTITVTVVCNDGTTLPSELTVTVPHCGRCKDLIQALTKACGLGEDEYLLLAEVYNSRILQFLDDLSGSLALIRDSDCLVAYRLPKYIESGEVVVFMHQQEERSYFGRPRTDINTFGVPLVTILSNISSESCIRKEFLKLIRPFRLHEADISDHTDTGNSDNEDTKMEESRSLSDDDSSTEDDKVQSLLDNDFQFHEIDEYGICKGFEAEQKKPLNISGAVKTLKFIVSWPNRMMRKYNTRLLSLLPEVFQHGMSAKYPQESVLLDKCLEAFLKEEPLGPEDMWYCPNCKKHRQAKKKLDLWRLPEVLVIHLKRFSYSRFLTTKLETFVDFPINKLDITGFIGHKSSSVSNCYKLYAISNHYGGMGGGHYTALVHQGNQWYEFDDSCVGPVSEDSIKTSAAYVLFYQRVSGT